jgi:hypothetical protein
VRIFIVADSGEKWFGAFDSLKVGWFGGWNKPSNLQTLFYLCTLF